MCIPLGHPIGPASVIRDNASFPPCSAELSLTHVHVMYKSDYGLSVLKLQPCHLLQSYSFSLLKFFILCSRSRY